jgi:hypothetical protein
MMLQLVVAEGVGATGGSESRSLVPNYESTNAMNECCAIC